MLFTILPTEMVGPLLEQIAQFKAGLAERAKRHGGIKAFVLPVEQMI
jgi:hypothetical protein